jgi:hypothetical protein
MDCNSGSWNELTPMQNTLVEKNIARAAGITDPRPDMEGRAI